MRKMRYGGVKRAVAWMVSLYLLATGCAAALAAPGDGAMYAEEFIDPDTGRPVYAYDGSTAELDGAFYTLYDARLYRWTPGEAEPTLFCGLPPIPAGTEYLREDLSAEVAAKLSEAVTHIAGGDGALWAFNDYALRVGTIDADGLRWLPLALDTSVLSPEEAQYLRVSRCWVREGALECLANLADASEGMRAMAVLRFDLRTGAATKTALPDALMTCPYKPGSYLAYTAVYDEKQGKIVSTLLSVDGATGERTALPQTMPGAEYAIGGLSYDAAADRICYAHQGEIWGSAAGAPFVSLAYLPVAAVYDDAQAWQLPGDRYAINSGGLYVRSVDPQYKPQRTLRLSGVWNDKVYDRFVKTHPEVPAIIAEYNETSATEVAQAMREGTSDIDIYAMTADPGWRALIDKGFVADLSISEKLTADVARMYPAMRSVLEDDAGKLRGYPVFVYGNTWSVDEKLWARFDMGPLPTTYDALLDCWLRWDAEFAEANPELGFLQGGYDRFTITNLLLRDYIRRYEQPGQPLDLNTPLLHDLLAKIEQLDFGDWAERNKNGEVNDEYNEWINRPMLLSAYGSQNLTSNPEETPIYATDSEDVKESNVLHSVPMLPPVFVAGEEPMIEGQMQVLFISAASSNPEAALDYLEGAVVAGDMGVAYLAHPDRNEPLLRDDYAKERKQYEGYLADERERMTTLTDPLERKRAEEYIDFCERWLADAEGNKWMISPGAIRNMRAYAPYLRFGERASLLDYSGGGMAFMMELLDRYIAGQMTLDAFLKELDNKLRMVSLEGR